MAPEPEWKIVLIDDEAGIRKVTQIVLEDFGYQVETAENGEAGLAVCETFGPQIVITDVKMPGMDGLAVLETIRRDHPEIEVIVMTAFGDIETTIRALQLDASDFITKPVNDQALVLALDRAKNRYTSARQLREYTLQLETGWSSATQALMKKYSFQEQIINRSINGIIALGMDEYVRIINPSALGMLGMTADEVVGRKKLNDLLPKGEEDRIFSALKSDQFGGKDRINMMETAMQSASSSPIPVLMSASVMSDAGEDDGLLVWVRDLRELRRMEREMADQEKTLHQDKMLSLGKLAASVVHEINNPLSGILNYLRLMAKQVEKGEVVEKKEKFANYLDISISEISRCSGIISNLLAFSRKSAIAYGAVPVKELVERCVQLSQHKAEMQNTRLYMEIDSDIPDILADANQIQQCLINLIINALDAVATNGDVRGEVRLSADFYPGENQVTIHVKDSGKGITPGDLPHIFEPFFTTKDEGYGVGLGLSTVYGIMRSHGGNIRVVETSAAGTHFVLEFNKLA